MGKRGCRPVLVRAGDAAVAARWLRATAIPAMRKMPETILGGGYGKTIERMERLAAALTRKADRKRAASEFSALIEIEDAAAFALVVSFCRPAWPLRYDPAIMRLAAAMEDGGQCKRRGRGCLAQDDVHARVACKVTVEERHRMRLAARDRRNVAFSDAWDHWSAELRARGETILTSTVPFPKI